MSCVCLKHLLLVISLNLGAFKMIVLVQFQSPLFPLCSLKVITGRRGSKWPAVEPWPCTCLICVSMKLVWTWHFDIPVPLKNIESIWEACIHSWSYIQVRVHACVFMEGDWRLDKKMLHEALFQVSNLVKQMSCLFENRLFPF